MGKLVSTSSWSFGIDLLTKIPVNKQSTIEVRAGHQEDVVRANVMMKDSADPVSRFMSWKWSVSDSAVE